MAGKYSYHNFYLFRKKWGKNEKGLELIDLARKLIEKSFFFKKVFKKKYLKLPELIRKTCENFSNPPPPTPDMSAGKFPLTSMGG
jgi:hypothetical protein